MGIPIYSASLKPINFGYNEVIDGKRGYTTMIRQIISCLERADSENVFFCENDVLYHKSHFRFIPPKDDVFYYNTNNWRWKFSSEMAISYRELKSLSGMCCNRKLALEHYNARLELILSKGWDKTDSREPEWARKMGYEPGTKSKRQEMIPTNGYECWKSEYPNVDIRHKDTFSPPKYDLASFKHEPVGWRETSIYFIPGWNIKELFNGA